MTYRTSAGSAFYISQTFASAKTVSAVTNANPAVATSTAHGYVDDDEVLFTSGWEDATDTVYRINQTATDTFEFLGLNTTNTNFFAAAGGTGTAQLVSSWLEIPQIIGLSTSGGNPRNATVTPVKRRNGILIPLGFEPAQVTFTIGYDSGLTNWDTLQDISRSRTLCAYKSVNGNGAATYGYGYFSMGEQIQPSSDNAETIQATFSAQGRLINYAS